MPRPTFALCGTFSGATISAAKWLKKFDHEMEDYRGEDGKFPPAKYLDNLSMLLIDEASDWSESHPEAVRLLEEAEVAPSQSTVENFRSLLCEKFPSKAIEIVPIPIDVELSELHQRPDESLATYYKRVSNLMQRVGARDRPVSAAIAGLTTLESSMLDIILRAFIRGLNDPELRKEATRGMASTSRSLRSIYSLAEEARRTNMEIQKLSSEEARSEELEFLRSLVRKNMPSHQVASLLAEHQAAKLPRPPKYQPWSYATNPPQASPEPAPEPSYRRPQLEESRRPSYQYEAPQALVPNTNKANVGNPGKGPSNFPSNPGNRPRNFQPTPKEMPDRSTSKNPWINGTLFWSYGKDGLLCVKCGTKGHSAKTCSHSPLPAWEQSYLRMLVFGDNPQANFASVGFGEFDGAAKPYSVGPSILARDSTTSSPAPLTPSSSVDSYISPRANSLQFSFAGTDHCAESKAVEANLGEGSAPNKRSRVEDENIPPQEPTAVPRPQPYQAPQKLQTGMNQGPASQAEQPYLFQGVPEERATRKGRKRVGKKAEPQPLVGLFNGTQYDTPVSVRQLLQNYKIDITLLDLVAWSPTACKELKRLCTKVPKKRVPKPTMNPTTQAPPFQPNFQPGVQYPQGFQPVQFQGPQAVPQQQPQTGMNQAPFQPQQGMPLYQQFTQQPQQSQPSTQQTVGNPNTQLTLASAFSVGASTKEDKHTRFLRSLLGMDKAFRVPAKVKKPDNSEVSLEISQSQADQGSDMNVISMGLVRSLGLELHLLSEIGFKGLSMRTADHRDTPLQHWVWLHIGVEGIWRYIRCFVAPEVVSVTESGRSEHLSLILGIPWLYAVDAQISIRRSSIMVGDKSVGEEVREVKGPQMVFCKDHNLLMYPEVVMTTPKAPATIPKIPKATVEEVDDSSDSSSSESEDDLSDVEEVKRDFQ